MTQLTQHENARFGHLLEPIKDLAQNWSIDIASELEDYLAELESITITFEDGKLLDFTEAALLIQGSACIYSKKVEHLHRLVNECIGIIVDKKKDKQDRANKQRESGAGENAAENEEEEDEAFVTLDESLKEVDNIDLPASTTSIRSVDCRAFTLTAAPLALTTMPDSGGQTGPANSKGESMIASCKMHACSLHPSGALMLPHLHVPAHILASLPTPPMLSSAAAAAAAAFFDTSRKVEEAAENGDSDSDDGGDAGDAGGFSDTEMPDAEPSEGQGGWDEALRVEPPPVPPSPAGISAGEAMEEDSAGAAPPTPGGPQAGPQASPGGPQATPAARRAAPAVPPPAFDPWKALDPHDPSGAARRPFRKGRTYHAPPAADAKGGANAEEEEEEDEEDDDFLEGAGVLAELGLMPASACASPTSVLVPLRAPLWEQFDSLHSAAAKKRQAARKAARAEAAQRIHVQEEGGGREDVEVEPIRSEGDDARRSVDGQVGPREVQEGIDPPSPFDPRAQDDLDTGFGGGDDYSDREDEESERAAAAAAAALPLGYVDPSDPSGARAGSLSSAFPGASSSSSSSTRQSTESYEEMCRKHVEECLRASSSYHDDWELHRRVADWQTKVEPLLEFEEERAKFDISDYANRLLANFKEDEQVAHTAKQARGSGGSGGSGGSATSRPFEMLAQTDSKFEICRMFMTALELAHTKNIDLDASGSLEKGEMALTVSLTQTYLDKLEKLGAEAAAQEAAKTTAELAAEAEKKEAEEAAKKEAANEAAAKKAAAKEAAAAMQAVA